MSEDRPRSPSGSLPLAGIDSGDWAELPSARVRAGARYETGGAPPAGAERYDRGERLGRGGMGEVVLGRDPVLRRDVAIKRLLRADPDARRRLEREARITAVLDHPHIVPVYDAGIDEDGEPWYAMRVVRGQTLAQAIAATPAVEDRLVWVRSLLAASHAVVHAHGLGIVHRDLKPANLLLGAHGEVQVADWGLARPLQAAEASWSPVLTGSSVTVAGAVVGSPRYMSPEAASGEPPAVAMDVWGLGVCLYELLTGEVPVRGDSAREVLRRLLSEPLPAVLEVEPAAPPELAAVVARACHRDPRQRYPTVEALAADLEAWLDGRRVSAHVYPPGAGLRRAIQRQQVAVAALLTAVLVVGIGGGTALQRTRAALRETRAASAEAQSRLAAALAASARLAGERGARAEAETLAAAALVHGEHPGARGLLMDPSPRPVRAVGRALPDCASGGFSADGSVFVCRAGEVLAAWRTEDGALAWERPTDFDAVWVAGEHVVGRSRQLQLAGILDLATGVPRDHVRLERIDPRGVGWHPQLLAAGGVDHGLLIDVLGESAPRPIPEVGRALGTDEAGRYLVLQEEQLVVVEGEEQQLHPLPAALRGQVPWVVAADLGRQGRRVLLGLLQGEVAEVDLETGDVARRRLAEGAVRSPALRPGGSGGAALDERGAAWVWTGDGPARQLPGSWRMVRWSGPDAVVLVGDRLERWVLAPEGATVARRLPAGVSDLDWWGDTLAVCLGSGEVLGFDGAGALQHRFRVAETNVCKDVAISPDGEAVLGVGLEGRTAESRGLDAVERLRTLGSARRAVRLSTLRVGAPFGQGPAVATLDGKMLRELTRAGQALHDLEPAADRRSAVLITTTGKVFELTEQPPAIQQIATAPGIGRIALAGELLALAGDSSLTVQTRGGRQLWTQPTPTLVTDVDLSGDGRWLASGHMDGTVRIYEARTGVLRASMQGHSARVGSVQFSPDSRRLASGGWDQQLRTWELSVLEAEPAALVAEVGEAWGLDAEALLRPR